MPIYEYRCLDCKKRSSILVLSVSNPKPGLCSHCQSARMERLMSRFSSIKSDEARLAALADSDEMGGLDENDPAAMSQFMKQIGNELGEDLGDESSQGIAYTDEISESLDITDSE